MTTASICIGIDLGTTNSCGALYYANDVPKNPTMISFDDSKNTFPSVVCFQENQVLIGGQAKKSREQYPASTYYCIKRLIGRYANDYRVSRDIQSFPFKVDKDGKNRFVLPLLKDNKEIPLHPEQISGLVLNYVKDKADKMVNNPSNKAVIAVPANFNDYQRKATMDAAKIAGLDPIAVISEPIAASICYVNQNPSKGETKHIIVYDYGGGTLDVALVRYKAGDFVVLATAGDTACGGQDYDKEITDYLINQILVKFHVTIDKNDENDKKHFANLLRLAEEAKIALSSADAYDISLSDIKGISSNSTIPLTKAFIDELVDKKEKSLINPIKDVLEYAKMKPEDISDLILVGGSSRIPKVGDIVSAFLKKKAQIPVNPDEAIAIGAALYGAYKCNAKIKNLPELHITEVTPMDIGFGLRGGKMGVAIPRNTPKPCESLYQPYSANSYKKIPVPIFEGNDSMTSKNFSVGVFNLVIPENNKTGRVWLKIKVTEERIKVMAFIGENAPTTEQESTMQRVDIETIKSTFSQEEITEMRNQYMGFQEPPKFEIKYHEALNAKLNEIRQAAQKLKNRIKDPKEKKKKFDVIDKFIKKVKNDAKIYNEENLMSEEVYESFVKQTLDQMQGVFGDLFKRDSIKVKPEEEK